MMVMLRVKTLVIAITGWLKELIRKQVHIHRGMRAGYGSRTTINLIYKEENG